ncbi:MAG: PepSY domain-containing protein [Halobacteriota archaeon]
MKKEKWLIAGGVVGVLVVALLVGGIAMPSFAQGTTSPAQTQAQTEEQVDNGPNEQFPRYGSSIRVDDTRYEGMSETDEAAALAGMATITPEQAKAIALKAYPNTSCVELELDNENGALVYGVELSNGMDVKVDAGNGAVLYVDSGNDHEDFGNDNIERDSKGEEDHEG